MSDSLTLEALAAEIRQRLDGVDAKISESVSDTRLADLVRTQLDGVLDDEETVRKLKFAGGGAAELVGTKYARLGLDVGDVEMLHDILRAAHEVGLSKQGPSEELTRTFEAVSQGRYQSTALARADDERYLLEQHRAGRLDRAGYRRAQLAMDTAESGFGQQLVGAQYVQELWDAPRRLGRIFPLIDSFEMAHPTAFLPVEVDIPEMLFVAEHTGPTDSDYATVKTGSQRVQVDAKKFIIHQMWSGEMEEDSIIPFIPFLRRQAGLSIAHYADSLVLNGDTTNTATGNINLDDSTPGATKHYLAFDGIRHAFLVDNTANGTDAAGAVTLNLLNSLRALMIDTTNLVDWGHPTDMADVVVISDPFTADKVALIDEYLTLDKYGPNATIFNGEAGRILGHPHVSSIAMPLTEADGKVSNTGANNTKGQIVALNRRGYKVGWRRRVQVETERLPGRDQTRIVYSLRLGFGRFTPTGAASGIESASGLYNISV